MEKVYLVTGNSEKLEAAEHALGDSFDINQIDPDLPEIQADSSLKVARHTVEQLIDEYDAPVIREDHSVYLNAFQGFPGPYMSYYDRNMPVEDLLKMLEGVEDRTGYFEISTVLGLPDGEIREYSFQVPIEFVEEPRGDKGNWIQVMKLEDGEKTFAESDSSERMDKWNRNFRKIADELEELNRG